MKDVSSLDLSFIWANWLPVMKRFKLCRAGGAWRIVNIDSKAPN